VRRFLTKEAPPVPQDVDERLHVIDNARVAKRVARPKALNISSKSKALEPGQPSAGLGITYSPLSQIPEIDAGQVQSAQQATEDPSDGGNHDKIPACEEKQTVVDSPKAEEPRETPQHHTAPRKPKSPKAETHKLQKSPVKAERRESARPRGILKSGPGYIPKTQSTANSNFGFWAIMFGLNMISILSALEATILSTALPTIVDKLEGDGLYIWAVNAYFLAR
jgi:hypothetical protein